VIEVMVMKRLSFFALGFALFACAPPNTEGPLDTSELPSAGSQLQYVGLTRDVVPADFDGDPDGKPDHAFIFTHTFADELTLKEVTLSRVENGSPNGIAGWTTTNAISKYWILKVQIADTDLNGNTRIASLDKKLSGQVVLNLFGSDARGYRLAEPGTVYELLMRFTDASGASEASNTEKTLRKRLTL